MRNHLIAIQGSVSSFHDIAAKKYFGEEVSVLECGSFREVCDKLKNNQADYGIIAIENKIAGSILLNYQLIETYDLKIIGETLLPIELKLLGKKGASINSIKEIVSHPMALGQSQEFLSTQTGKKITEFKDTSTCAKLVANDSSGNLAVIAGPALAKTYDLEILNDNVSDVKLNYTRFYILSKVGDFVADPNKASVTLRTADKAGQLSGVLNIIGDHNLNLTKIQSVPIVEDHNSYSFHLDIEFNDLDKFKKVIEQLKNVTSSIKVLGIYKKESLLSIGLKNKILKNMN